MVTNHTQPAEMPDDDGHPKSNFAHDFNNLFAVIFNYANFIEEEVKDRADLLADLRELRSAAERAESLTRELLHRVAESAGSSSA